MVQPHLFSALHHNKTSRRGRVERLAIHSNYQLARTLALRESFAYCLLSLALGVSLQVPVTCSLGLHTHVPYPLAPVRTCMHVPYTSEFSLRTAWPYARSSRSFTSMRLPLHPEASLAPLRIDFPHSPSSPSSNLLLSLTSASMCMRHALTPVSHPSMLPSPS